MRARSGDGEKLQHAYGSAKGRISGRPKTKAPYGSPVRYPRLSQRIDKNYQRKVRRQ
ncbi:unnamed protein product [marine sediment metagenome]|uniref:Uncharacterized protein n=1 Tax=marine sediment metagenome TaxID=412755 RepID=X1I6Z2_9ZZZZ